VGLQELNVIKSRAKAVALKPMAHQKESLAHDKKNPAVFDMSDPGTGKTAVRVWSFADRRRRGAGCLLVLAPRSLLRTAWGNDFARFAPDMKVSVATAATRKEALSADADVYIINHDGVKDLLKQPTTWWDKFDEFVVDEATAYKHHTSQRSRAIAKIAHMKRGTKPVFRFRRLLTATPTSNGICDIWHQVYLLDGGARLGPNFYGFRDKVCIPKQVGRNAHAIQWADKDGAEEAVFGLLNELVVRHKFEDCVDIPPTHSYSVDYQLEPKQRKVYDDLESFQLIQLSSTKITAINAAAVATKLLQIASGAVYDGSGKYQIIDRGRYETLIEMAKVRKHPLMLFFWQHQKELLIEEAEKAGMNFCVFDGDASDAERNDMVLRYQQGMYDLMLGHPKTVAHGLTLTAGTSVIWPGPTYDLEWLKQANKRQARIGQKDKTEVVTLIAPDTIEEKVYAMVSDKGARMGNLLDLFESMSPKPLATRVARKLVAV
jgi:SNF2 family DNA or RNA helicase